jgi:hypothetical protein
MSTDDRKLEISITIDPGKPQHAVGWRSGPKSKEPDPPRIPRITRLMALAIKFQDMIDHREVRDYADLARLGYVTRARITQIMNLLNLAPDIQEEILLWGGESPTQVRESALRRITRAVLWSEQRRLWSDLR